MLLQIDKGVLGMELRTPVFWYEELSGLTFKSMLLLEPMQQ